MMRRILVLLVVGLLACGDVPDIRFVPDDAGKVGTTPEAGTSTPKDAGPETGTATPTCPAQPPPGGVCCGNNGCVGDRCAEATACSECAALPCTSGQLCCARPGNIQCKDRCN